MWNQFLEAVKQQLLLTESTQRNRADLTALQNEFKELTAKTEREISEQKRVNDHLVYELQRLHDKLENAQQREADAREKLRLKVENQILKAGRFLPAASEPATNEEDSEEP